MPKYSILLPTRNRLEYLRYAVETVLRQEEDDWEIIVSDNFSEDDIEGYCKELSDPRIHYSRTDSFVPVTENWNRAIDRAVGDYVIMLGDDDGLLPDYFSRLDRLIEDFGGPELIHTNAYLLAYPGAVPDHQGGYLARWTNTLFHATEPYVVDPETARRLAEDTIQFRVGFGWNMQFSVVSRPLIDRMLEMGPFYQSPYPDYYATNAMFLKSKSIVVCPTPMIAIGITPKSFGSFYFSGEEQAGVEMLNHATPDESLGLTDVVLPGEDHNTSWLVSVETLKRNLPEELRGTEVAYSRYRYLQIWHLYREASSRPDFPREIIRELRRQMTLIERAAGVGMRLFLWGLRFVSPQKRSELLMRVHLWVGQYPADTLEMLDLESPLQNMRELFDRELVAQK